MRVLMSVYPADLDKMVSKHDFKPYHDFGNDK